MIEAGIAEFEKSPVGRFTSTGSCVIWCASPSLCGWSAWGRTSEVEARTIFRLADQYPTLASRFDVVLDTREVEGISPVSLAVLVAWVFKHRLELKRRVRIQASLIRQDAIGFIFAGILPSLGESHPFRVFDDATEAFRAVAGEPGVAIAAEIAEIVARMRSIPHEVHVIRALIASRADATIEDAAKELATSPRSLQRVLTRHRTSFHGEISDARFARAKALLTTTDTKIAGIAAHVGLSERGLTLLFKERTELTPAEWRKRARV